MTVFYDVTLYFVLRFYFGFLVASVTVSAFFTEFCICFSFQSFNTQYYNEDFHIKNILRQTFLFHITLQVLCYRYLLLCALVPRCF